MSDIQYSAITAKKKFPGALEKIPFSASEFQFSETLGTLFAARVNGSVKEEYVWYPNANSWVISKHWADKR